MSLHGEEAWPNACSSRPRRGSAAAACAVAHINSATPHQAVSLRAVALPVRSTAPRLTRKPAAQVRPQAAAGTGHAGELRPRRRDAADKPRRLPPRLVDAGDTTSRLHQYDYAKY